MTSSSPAPAGSTEVADLYRLHHGWMLRWLQRKLGNASDAAELAHDAFVRLLSRPRQFNDAEHARAYLGRLSRNLYIDHWRRRQIEQAWLEVLAAQPPHYAPSLEQQALILETLGQLQAMLERLPDRVAEAFCLAQLQGLTHQQIARQLGVTERSVRSYMSQAMYQCLLLELELDEALT